MRQKALIALPLALLLAISAGCETGETEPAQVWFVHPQDGDTVTGPDVLVELGASGVRITSADVHEHGTGHHHLFVNTDLTPFTEAIPDGVTGILHMGRGQTEFLVQNLEPGENRLIAVIADWEHVPLNPPAVDTVRFTVVSPEEPEG